MNSDQNSSFGLGLEGKSVVVLGVADETSIGWGIAEAFLHRGARVRIGFQQKFFSRVRLLFQRHPQLTGQRCDVLNQAELRDFFDSMGDNPIDVLVHSIAYAPPEVFTRQPSAVSPEAMSQAMAISVYSLPDVVRFAKSRLTEWGSVISLSFQAAQRAMPMYNMMGVTKAALESVSRYLALELGERKIRVNVISPGPVESLAALGIILAFSRDPQALKEHRGTLLSEAMDITSRENPVLRDSDELAWAKLVWCYFQRGLAEHCAIEELICKEDVANCALFLGSDLSRKITGQVLLVDSGFSSSLII